MNLLDDETLERSAVVANSRMNRERGAIGVNSYERELGIDPIAFLSNRLLAGHSVSWLDICCGRGRALIDAAHVFKPLAFGKSVVLRGIDLVDGFDEVTDRCNFVHFRAVSLHAWEAAETFDLITCVHGLHYIGDKLSLLERATRWLKPTGLFVGNVDLRNLKREDGATFSPYVLKTWRTVGGVYDARRHLLKIEGSSVEFNLSYLGADDAAGPNYTGQEGVDSYYETE